MRRLTDFAVRAALVLAALAIAGLFMARFLTLPETALPPIAHAGGGIEGATYTNSISALDANYDRGFRLFEIDFLRTRDGHTICGHDWDQLGGEALSLAEFTERRMALDHPPCTLTELAEWFAAHPQSYLVSDAKANDGEIVLELQALLTSRLIAQAYGLEQVCALRQAGLERIILTLYKLPPTYRALLSGLRNDCISNGRPQAITVDATRVRRGHALIAKLLTGLPVYAHTVNDCSSARLLYLLGADQFYTDFLPPGPCGMFGGDAQGE